MESGIDYLKEFCNYHGIFRGNQISQSNINKISHNFGVEGFYLHHIKNIEQLEKVIKKYKRVPLPVKEDSSSELIRLIDLQLSM